ncbi:MAG: hypothetical protein AAGF28_06995 [Pseudomonadota bacterium]
MGRRPNLLPDSARLELLNVFADTQTVILSMREKVNFTGGEYSRLTAVNDAMNELAVEWFGEGALQLGTPEIGYV